MKPKRICIVGSSIAGLSTALALLSSEYEAEVTLHDAKPLVGSRVVCAGGISSYMVRKLNLAIPEQFVASKVTKVRFYAPSMDYAEVSTKREYGLVLWRGEYEAWLAHRIELLGGKFQLGKAVTKMNFPKDVDFVVGSDGITGVTRRLVGLKLPKRDVHVAMQGVARLNHPKDTISMFLGHIAPEGYGWVFPERGKRFRMGLGVPVSYGQKVRHLFTRLQAKLDADMVEKPKSKLIPTAKPMRSLVFRHKQIPVLLVGDAGLQTDAATGGGIANAIIGGRCAAEAIVKGKPELYDRLWKKELYRRNMLRYAVKQIFSELSDGEICLLVDSLKDFKVLIGGSLGLTLAQGLIHLALKHPKVLVRHKVLKRLARSVVSRVV